MQPKADTTSAGAVKIVSEITAHIIEVYGGNTESMRIKYPNDPLKSIRITQQNLWIWARAILHNAPNVDLDHPPKTSHFGVEDIQVHTLAEHASKLASCGRLSTEKNCLSHNSPPSKAPPPGNC